ncbi:MAG TPA: Gfo/Idh/MocA family oxidoreductase, partial [Vicinamibacteria bacterium]
MSAVRLGVIGVGGIGRHHARVCASLKDAVLAGVYDVDLHRGREVAEAHGGRAFPHLRDLLPEVDAVCVAVPTVDHLRVARAALEAGKDVLVEKP